MMFKRSSLHVFRNPFDWDIETVANWDFVER